MQARLTGSIHKSTVVVQTSLEEICRVFYDFEVLWFRTVCYRW